MAALHYNENADRHQATMKDGKPLYRTTYVISQPIDVHVEKRNAGRQNNSKAYDLNNTRRTVTFISNYADDHALVLPGRVPGFQRDDVRLMPSSETKVKVYGAYRTSMRDLGMLRYELVDVSHYCSLCCLLLNYNPLLLMILLKLICNNTVFGKFYDITHIF